MNDRTTPVAQKILSRVAWGGVVAGFFVATTSFMVFGAFATAMSLSFGTEALFESPLWISSLTMAAMYCGGLTASFLSAGERFAEAVLHGIVLWGATALALLFFAWNGVSLYGSEMIVGQSGDLFGEISAQDAWWAVIGIVTSLWATICGSLTGALRSKLLVPMLLARRSMPRVKVS